MTFGSYEQFVGEVVLPRRRANPSHLRLDGEQSGGNWSVAGTFRHGAREWRVHEDSHFEPLLIAYAAVQRGEDPFDVETTRAGRVSLVLKPSLRAQQTTRYKHFYVYEV